MNKNRKRSIITYANHSVFFTLLILAGVFLFINIFPKAFLKNEQKQTMITLTNSTKNTFTNMIQSAEIALDTIDSLMMTDEKEAILLQNIISNCPLISAVEIIDENGQVIFSTMETIGMDRSNESFYQSEMVAGQFYWSDIFISFVTGKPVLTTTKRFEQYFISAYIDLESFRISAEIIQNDLGAKTSISVLTEYGKYIYHPNQDYLKEQAQNDEITRIREAFSNQDYVIDSIDRNSQLSISYIESLQWYVVLRVKNSDIFGSIHLINIILLLATVLILLSLTFYYRRTYRISQTIKKFADIVNDYKMNTDDIPIVDTRFKEMDLLSNNFHDMSKNLKASYSNERKMELKFLRSQIQPHFINNSLNAIIAIMRYDTEKARLLLIEFSRYLRSCYDFQSLDEMIPLENELSYVKAYLALESARFQDKLHVIYDIDKSIRLGIPPLTLQPLVENAVIHGVRSKKSGGTITIFACVINENVRLGVRDDGPGLRQEKLDTILGGGSENKQVGLYNINNRLKSIFNTSLQFYNLPEGGLEVFMDIPNHKL